MNFLEYFKREQPCSANVAKERLKIIVAHERLSRDQPDYLPRLQREIMEVVARYVKIAEDHVQVTVDHNGNYSVLELNITLPKSA
ncbi:cell division topological specificity factor [Allopseudospirillum japonicum]|uniref:Cell division topological specificity factor n=1 Tax=Allopseudospirillum japonicum TaxID=64971 RepID=A0A1H6RHY9_9GAMM|nr:cell division topological specificity factor MinE [Allopseudospirillum japonicum]SEI52924.1 cell division topological specificity factor [Allopseudospirillum japonicum]